MCTFDALVRGLEVRFEVLGTRFVLGELRIGDADLAAAAAGAACVGQLENVRLAAEMAVVELDTAADPHSAVLGPGHDDHLVQSARRVERLRLAERRVIGGRRCNDQHSKSELQGARHDIFCNS